MCAAIEFQNRQILFTDDDPQLPLLLRDESVGWVPWGRPYAEQRDRRMPAGGWARLESIHAGAWKKYGAKPVQILARRYMERAKDGRAVWFDVPDGLVIQGAAIKVANATLQAEFGAELVRAYVVTVPAIGDVAAVHDRMPRLVRTDRNE